MTGKGQEGTFIICCILGNDAWVQTVVEINKQYKIYAFYLKRVKIN